MKQRKKSTKLILSWSIMMMLLFCFAERSFATGNSIVEIQQQGQTVTGRVTDQRGEVVIGATVIESGTTHGVITNFDGLFSITLTTPDASLDISFIGLEPQTVAVGGRNIVNVVLREDVNLLDEVIIVAYGTIQRSQFAGAAEVITERQLMQSPSANIMQALQGQAAGLMIATTSGQVGAEANIAIRGMGSISASTQPLILIDNAPATMDEFMSLAPADISTVTVLKDAASTSVFGARAANGVIMVATRSGVAGQTRISFTGNFSSVQVQNMARKMDGPQFAQFANMAARQNRINDVPFKRIENVTTRDFLTPLLRPGFRASGVLQISGGGQGTTYIFSVNYLQHQGLMPNTNQTRLGLRANIRTDLTPSLRFLFNTTANVEERQTVAGGENGAFFRFGNMVPIMPATGPGTGDGHVTDDGFWYCEETGELMVIGDGAATTMLGQQLFTRPFNYAATATLTYTPRFLPGFTFTSRTHVAYRNTQTYNYTPKSSQMTTVNAADRNIARRRSATRTRWQIENFANYSLSLNDNRHNLRFMIGQSVEQIEQRGFGVDVRNFPHDHFGWHNLAAAQDPWANFWNTSQFETMASFFGNVGYTLLDRYTIDFTLRADGSSRFGPQSKWGYFPAIGLRWNARQEPFFQNMNNLSRLSLRASWGITGNDRIAQGTSLSTLEAQPVIIGGETTSASAWTQMGNLNIRWERQQMYNVGLETGFFRNAILFNTDLYLRRTSDLLHAFQLPMTTGFASVQANVGEIENKGIEMSLTTRNIDTRNFRWTTTANVSLNRNRVLRLGYDDAGELQFVQARTSNGQISRLMVGQPMAVFVGHRTSVWQSWEEIFAVSGPSSYWHRFYTQDNHPIAPGSVRFWGTGPDGRLSENPDDDLVVLGQNVPVGIASLTNTFTYRNLALTVFFNGAWGNQIMNMNASRLMRLDTGNNSSLRGFETWRGMNVLHGDVGFSGNFGAPSWTSNPPGMDSGLSMGADHRIVNRPQYSQVPHDMWLEDGAFLRLQTVTLSYDVPRNIVQRLGLGQIRISGSAQNLWTLTRYTGMDPEMSSNHTFATGNPNTAMGWDTDAFPASTTYTIDLHIRF